MPLPASTPPCWRPLPRWRADPHAPRKRPTLFVSAFFICRHPALHSRLPQKLLYRPPGRSVKPCPPGLYPAGRKHRTQQMTESRKANATALAADKRNTPKGRPAKAILTFIESTSGAKSIQISPQYRQTGAFLPFWRVKRRERPSLVSAQRLPGCRKMPLPFDTALCRAACAPRMPHPPAPAGQKLRRSGTNFTWI